MRVGYIYKVAIGPHFIVGSTLNPKTREQHYLYDLTKGIYNNSYVQNTFNKYKELKMTILQENIPEDILTCVEDIWIGSLCARAEDKKGGMNMQTAQLDKNIDYSKFNKCGHYKPSIIQYSVNDEYLRTFESKEDAIFFLNFSNECKGCKTITVSKSFEATPSHKYIWRYG